MQRRPTSRGAPAWTCCASAAPRTGLPFGEAILFFDPGLAEEFARRRKQGGQLASKMRFLAAPWLGVLKDGAWLRHAAHANAMAQRLAAAIGQLPGARLLAPVEANGVFIDLPEPADRRGAREGLALLQLRRRDGCALHVLVGHDAGDRRCVRRRSAWRLAFLNRELAMALRPDQTVEILNARSKGRLPGLVGYRVTALEEGKVTAELDVRPDLVAPNGYLHAATVIALADTACGYGCLAHLPAGAELFTTIELKANFLGTAHGRHDRVRGDAGAPGRHHANLGRRGDAQVGRQEDRALPLHADSSFGRRRRDARNGLIQTAHRDVDPQPLDVVAARLR